MCEGELEYEQNCNISTPALMAISVSFPFSWVAQPEARGPSSILGCCFLYSIISPTLLIPQNWLNFLCTELYNSSTSTQSLPITGHRNMLFRRLWNGMFDRHRAEITVMQFTGHSLPVHQFVTVPWDFNPCPLLSAKLAHANGICNFRRLWNDMLGPGRRSIYNTYPQM